MQKPRLPLDSHAVLALLHSAGGGGGLLFFIRNNEDMSAALIGREYGRNRIRLATHFWHMAAASATMDFITFVDDNSASILTMTYLQGNKEGLQELP